MDAAHSLLFTAALRLAGVPAELHVFPHGRHGLGLATGVPGPGQWTRLCAEWLAGQGWITPDAAARSDAAAYAR